MKKHFDRIEEYIGGTLFIVMLIVLVFQIVARQVFDMPLKWSEEFARFLFVYIGYFGVSSAIKEDQHVYIDFFVKKFPDVIQKIIHVLIQVIILGVLIIMVYIGGVMTIRKIPVKIVSLNLSYAYMYIALPVIGVLMVYRHIEKNYIWFKNWRDKK